MNTNEPSRLDRLEALVEKNAALAEKNMIAIDKLTRDIDQQREESKELGLRFGYYQQSTQAVVNLAFSSIASATISVFVTVVLKP
jgi:chemotaxis regulatin CheY-phosphate phosphatase CheZ